MRRTRGVSRKIHACSPMHHTTVSTGQTAAPLHTHPPWSCLTAQVTRGAVRVTAEPLPPAGVEAAATGGRRGDAAAQPRPRRQQSGRRRMPCPGCDSGGSWAVGAVDGHGTVGFWRPAPPKEGGLTYGGQSSGDVHKGAYGAVDLLPHTPHPATELTVASGDGHKMPCVVTPCETAGLHEPCMHQVQGAGVSLLPPCYCITYSTLTALSGACITQALPCLSGAPRRWHR